MTDAERATAGVDSPVNADARVALQSLVAARVGLVFIANREGGGDAPVGGEEGGSP